MWPWAKGQEKTCPEASRYNVQSLAYHKDQRMEAGEGASAQIPTQEGGSGPTGEVTRDLKGSINDRLNSGLGSDISH